MGLLEGKVAFVTGAARGQGRSHALRLAEEGADIIALDICRQIETVPYPLSSPEDLEEPARQANELGQNVVSREVDVREGEALISAVNDGVAQLGRLDIVIANAGVLSVGASFELSEQAWSQVI